MPLPNYDSDVTRNQPAADRRWYSNSSSTIPHCTASRFRQMPDAGAWKLDVCTASDLACASEPVDGSGDVRSFCSMSTEGEGEKEINLIKFLKVDEKIP